LIAINTLLLGALIFFFINKDFLISSESTILTFVGILVTIVVVSNYWQMYSAEKRMDSKIDEIKEQNDKYLHTIRETFDIERYMADSARHLSISEVFQALSVDTSIPKIVRCKWFRKYMSYAISSIKYSQLSNFTARTNAIIDWIIGLDISVFEIKQSEKDELISLLSSIPNKESLYRYVDLKEKIDSINSRKDIDSELISKLNNRRPFKI